MSRVRARVLRREVLNGTIDGHDPLVVVYRITGGLRPFRLVHVTANLGRGYSPAKFRRNVMRILERIEEPQYVVLNLQEIDEADPAEELKLIERWMEPGTTIVCPETREPIAVSPDVPVKRIRRTLLMEQGTKIGAPVGTGPRRDYVTCVITIEGVEIGVGNQHPHRDLDNPKVQHARRRGERVVRHVNGELVEVCDLVVWAGDVNDHDYPKTHPLERNVHTRGNDTMRLIVA